MATKKRAPISRKRIKQKAIEPRDILEPLDQLEAMEQHSLIIPPHPEMSKLPQEPCAGGAHKDIIVQGGKYVCRDCGVTVR